MEAAHVDVGLHHARSAAITITAASAIGEKRTSVASSRPAALRTGELPGRGGQREQQAGDASDPDARREHVQDVGGEEDRRRALDARVAGQGRRGREVGAQTRPREQPARRRRARASRRARTGAELAARPRRAPAGASRTRAQPVDRAQAPHLPEAAFERAFERPCFSATPTARRRRRSRPAAGCRARSRGSRARRARASSHRMRRANMRAASCHSRSAPATAREARPPGDEQEREAAEQQRDREVVQAAHDPERHLGDLAALVAGDQAGDGDRRAPPRRGRC